MRCRGSACGAGMLGEPGEPIGILRITAAKGKDSVGQPTSVRPFRTHPHEHGTIASLFKREPVLGHVERVLGAGHGVAAESVFIGTDGVPLTESSRSMPASNDKRQHSDQLYRLG